MFGVFLRYLHCELEGRGRAACRRCDGTSGSKESGVVEKEDVHTLLLLAMESGGEYRGH